MQTTDGEWFTAAGQLRLLGFIDSQMTVIRESCESASIVKKGDQSGTYTTARTAAVAAIQSIKGVVNNVANDEAKHLIDWQLGEMDRLIASG